MLPCYLRYFDKSNWLRSGFISATGYCSFRIQRSVTVSRCRVCGLIRPAKLQIAQGLARAGIHSIDAGFPAAAREEIDSIQQIARTVRGPVINAHCRTLHRT